VTSQTGSRNKAYGGAIHYRFVEYDAYSKVHDLDRRRAVLPVLIYLYGYGPAPKTTLSRLLLYRHETITKTLDTLDRYGLVILRKERWFPYRQAYELTPFGRRLVEAPIHEWPLILDAVGKVTAS